MSRFYGSLCSSHFNGDDWFQVFVSDFDRLCCSLSLRLGFRQNSANDMTLTRHLMTKLLIQSSARQGRPSYRKMTLKFQGREKKCLKFL